VYVEKYNVKIDVKQDVRKWIRFMCQERAHLRAVLKNTGNFLAT